MVYDDAASDLYFVDVHSLQIDFVVPIPIFPSGLLYDPADSTIWVAYARILQRLCRPGGNTTDGAAVATLTDPYSPVGMGYSSAFEQVFVGNLLGANVSVYSATTFARIASIPSRAILPRSCQLLRSMRSTSSTTDSPNVTVISAENDTRVGVFFLPQDPISWAYDATSNSILIGAFVHRWHRLNASDGEVIATVEVPYVNGISIDRDTGNAFLMLYSNQIDLWNRTGGGTTSILAGVNTSSGVRVEGVGAVANDPGGGTVVYVWAVGRRLADRSSV